MKDNHCAIAGKPNVALDTRARFHRSSEGGNTVFRKVAAVNPAMREPLGSGIERVRP